MTNQIHRVRNRFTDKTHRRGGQDDAQAREQEHRQRQSNDLANDLAALRARVTTEVGNIQRQRGPKSNHGRERGHEVFDEGRILRAVGRDRENLAHRDFRQGPDDQAYRYDE